jgi:hypothetical protein
MVIPMAVTTSIRLEKIGKHTKKMDTTKNPIGYTKLTCEHTKTKHKRFVGRKMEKFILSKFLL